MKKAIMIIVAMVAGITLLTACATTGRVEEIEEKLDSLIKAQAKGIKVDGYGQGIEAIEINMKIKLQQLQPSQAQAQVHSEPKDSDSIKNSKPD